MRSKKFLENGTAKNESKRMAAIMQNFWAAPLRVSAGKAKPILGLFRVAQVDLDPPLTPPRPGSRCEFVHQRMRLKPLCIDVMHINIHALSQQDNPTS